MNSKPVKGISPVRQKRDMRFAKPAPSNPQQAIIASDAGRRKTGSVTTLLKIGALLAGCCAAVVTILTGIAGFLGFRLVKGLIGKGKEKIRQVAAKPQSAPPQTP